MSPRTLGLYAAKWAIDPEDENRADLRAGEIAAAVVNAAGAKKDDGSHFTPEDFTPYLRAQVDPDELARRVEAENEARLMAFFEARSKSGAE